MIAPQHIVIIGAGHAGGSAAIALRAAGFAGDVTLIGAEASPPYERPPLSKELLAGAVAVEKTYLRPAEWYADNAVDLRLNTRVLEIDRAAQRLRLADGENVPYDALLLTTGSRARTLPFEGDKAQPAFYVRDIADALALRERLQPGSHLAVIGAGFIGLEIAATARKRGCAVTVLELAPQPLARIAPAPIGDYAAALHRRNGIDLRLGCRVAAIEARGDGFTIRTADRDTIGADMLAIGIGGLPNVELGVAAGLAADDGIVVNEFGQTSDAAIFAAGDVTKHFNPVLGRALRLEAWQNAQNGAIAVAKVMAGGADPYAEVPWLWTDQYDMNMQVAGAPTAFDQIVYRGDPATGRFTAFQMLGQQMVGAITVNSGRDMRFARLLIAGKQALDAERLADSSTKLQDLCR